MVVVVIVLNLAEETRDSTVDTSRACTNRRGGKDKCGNGISELIDRVCILTRLICYGCG